MTKLAACFLAGVAIGSVVFYLCTSPGPARAGQRLEKAPIPCYPNAVLSYEYKDMGGSMPIISNHTEWNSEPLTKVYSGQFVVRKDYGFRLSYQILLSTDIEYGQLTTAEKEKADLIAHTKRVDVYFFKIKYPNMPWTYRTIQYFGKDAIVLQENGLTISIKE